MAVISSPVTPSGTVHVYVPGHPADLPGSTVRRTSCKYPLLLKSNASVGRGTVELSGYSHSPIHPPNRTGLVILSFPLQQPMLTFVVIHLNVDPAPRPSDSLPMSLRRTDAPGK